MPCGAHQLVDDAVPADIFANRSYLPVDDERPGVDSASLLSEVPSGEHPGPQGAQSGRVGEPVDEFGFSPHGFSLDGGDVIR